VSAPDVNTRLSRISTRWTAVFQAHDPGSRGLAAAQQQLLQRYCGAVYRYLLGALGDADLADEAAQEFAHCLVRGECQRAEPGHGRFRDFVKAALLPLIVDYQRRRKAPQARTGLSAEELATLDRDFAARWREELMAKAWEALAAVQEQTGQPLHAALRLRDERPELKAEALAAELSTRLGPTVSAREVRQLVRTARQTFGELLVAEVARSLQANDPLRLRQELIDLGLFEYCRPAMEKSV
jgi:DNA-directed RNA polymerase specialized sigma24 family protein